MRTLFLVFCWYNAVTMRSLLRVLLVFVLPGSEVRAESQGIIVRQATVYADASIAGVMVTLFKRKGGWREIYSEERSIQAGFLRPGGGQCGSVS